MKREKERGSNLAFRGRHKEATFQHHPNPSWLRIIFPLILPYPLSCFCPCWLYVFGVCITIPTLMISVFFLFLSFTLKSVYENLSIGETHFLFFNFFLLLNAGQKSKVQTILEFARHGLFVKGIFAGYSS